MARRIRWQIVLAVVGIVLVAGLLGRLALANTSVASPLTGGTYSEALIGTPVSVIPLLNDPLNDPIGRDIIALTFDGLVRLGLDGLPTPALAESFEVDTSGEVYTFRLRQGVQWHDGAPVTIDDVLFTLRTIQSYELGEAAQLEFWRSALIDRIDARTLRITLNGPLSSFPALAQVPIMPAHLLAGIPPEQWADSGFAERPIGTGPYQVREIGETRALLEANSAYFGGSPFINQIELRFIASPEAAEAALRRGDLQALGSRTRLELATIDLPPNLQRYAVPLDEYAVLTFNLNDPRLQDQSLRQALAYGFNKNEMIDRALNGLAAPLDTPLLPGWWAHDPTQQWYPPEPQQAARILSELGYEPGPDGVLFRDDQPLFFELITDTNPRRLAAAEEVARQWRELGLVIQVEALDGNALIDRLQRRDFDLAVHSYVRLGADPDVYGLWHSSQAVNGLNYSSLQDPQIDDLLSNARRESEIVVRADDYAAFQQRWIELAPSIMLYQPFYIFIADRDLGGLGFEEDESAVGLLMIGSEDRYRDVVRWYVNSSREIDGSLR